MKPLVRLVAYALLTTALTASAQTWPAKPVRVVVPYPAGGGVDFVARTVSQRLADVHKQPFVIDNHTGASGTIGTDMVAKSAPDGYTLLVGSPAEVLVGPIAGQKVPYDPQHDLMPVALIGETPLVIATNPALPVSTIQELISLAKSQPGKLSYATPGSGTPMHFAGESLNAIAGISMTHIPYRGAAPAVTDVLGGQVPVGIVGMPPVVQHAKSGKLRVLAVTSATRSPTMPEVPAMAEVPGFAGYRFTNWFGVYVPARTPQAVVVRIAAEVMTAVQEPATRGKLVAAGVEPVSGTPAEFADFLKAERRTYLKVATERRIRADE